MRDGPRVRGRMLRLAFAVLALSVSVPGLGSAHGTANGFQDGFEAYKGPLQGTLPSDAYEIKSGVWKIIEQPLLDQSPSSSTNHVLLQDSKANNLNGGNEPLVFVRNKSFRSLTAQVTTAMMDPINAFGDLTPGSSVGLIFRAPITDGISDKDNLYLFSEVVTGVAPGFSTGKAYVLFKRVARGYYFLSSAVASTSADFSRPHELKVVMTAGHIQAFVDGRRVIEHTDIPSPDVPTSTDPFPGLPFDQGAVGLRTSATRAWFDDFAVVGNDAYEARANLLDAYTNYTVQGQGPQGAVRRGVAAQASRDIERAGLGAADTGFLYHDHDFDEAVVRPLGSPGGSPSAGALLGAAAKNGVVTTRLRLTGVNLEATDADGRVTIQLTASALEVTANASCSATGSTVWVTDGTVSVRVSSGAGDTVIGPIPLSQVIRPNQVIYERSNLISIVAHSQLATTLPHRVDAALIRVILPEGGEPVRVPAQQIPPPQGVPVPGQRTSELSSQGIPFELTLAQVVAGRYCP